MKRILLISILLIGLSTLLLADPDCMNGKFRGKGRGMMGQDHGKMMGGRRLHRERMSLEFMKDELDLTENQVAEMKKDRMSFEKFRISKEAEIKKLQIDRRQANEDHDFDKLKKISEQISKLRREIAQQRIELREKHWNLLTKEQQKKAEELKKDKFPMRKDFQRKMMRDDDED